MDATAYVLGRDPGALASPFHGRDKLYAAGRLDGRTVQQGEYEHCTFANISFKEAVLRSCRFLDCAFIGCYFRRADLRECSFVGCKFIDCEFPRVAVQGCDFRYSRFSRCVLPYAEIELSLPQEPNLREDLSRNLAVEASRLGLAEDAKAFRLSQIRSREQDLRAAMNGDSQWYREHYDALRRVGAGIRLAFSVLNRWLWGYGEKVTVLLRNCIVAAALLFPGLFYLVRDDLVRKTGGSISVADALYFSLKNFLPSGVESDLVAHGAMARTLSGIEGFIGVIAVGLFASYLFRWILDR